MRKRTRKADMPSPADVAAQYASGMSLQRIAATYGISVSGVYGRLRMAEAPSGKPMTIPVRGNAVWSPADIYSPEA